MGNSMSRLRSQLRSGNGIFYGVYSILWVYVTSVRLDGQQGVRVFHRKDVR